MPKLSIITINLNNAEGLEGTICSVINQTYFDFEYIVIDGGSTDGSVDVIKKYADRLSYWISEPDTGIYNAMNKGIRKAAGEYCQFLNSGDWLIAPDVTERMLKGMPDCAICYGNMITVQNGRPRVDKGFEGKLITLSDLFLSTINHSPAYIRRDLFGKYGVYDETLKIVSDWKFYLIAVGLRSEVVAYRDVNVTMFDVTGISNRNLSLRRMERQTVIRELINANIIRDLEEFASIRDTCRRLKKYPWVWFIVRFLNFAIRKSEKCPYAIYMSVLLFMFASFM
jgi:glycosyltransferase involved in cell wall biosynthesis